MPEQTAKPDMSKDTRWTHGFAWALLVVLFTMVSVGALATSYSAEMAISDWPTTFGHNPLLYPLGDWFGNGDIFLVHTYRLLSFLAGGLSLVLTALLWKSGMRWLGLAVLIGYLVQESLGALRVLQDEIMYANLRDCAAALLVALALAAVIVTSTRWNRAEKANSGDAPRWLPRLAVGALLVVYLQIVLGAQLRHLPVDAPVIWFEWLVWLHLIVATIVLAAAVALFVLARRSSGEQLVLRRRAGWLLGLVLAQAVLGATGWVTRFGWPIWFADLFGRPDYTVVAEGPLQVLATSTHVMVGMLCLLATLSLAFWARRLLLTHHD